jgi:hypothetical protein
LFQNQFFVENKIRKSKVTSDQWGASDNDKYSSRTGNLLFNMHLYVLSSQKILAILTFRLSAFVLISNAKTLCMKQL